MSNFGRVPVVALSYLDKNKAVPKELLVNYDTGDIYIKSVDGVSPDIDITASIRSKLTNLDGNTIDLDIDGIGTIRVSDIIVDIIDAIDNGLDVIEEESSNISYTEKQGTLDNKSLENKNEHIQIKDYDEAETLTLPYKDGDGILRWVSLLELAQLNRLQDMDNQNPADGKASTVDYILPVNDKVNLLMDKRQKTINPQNNTLNIILPKTIDEYAVVEWLLILGNNLPDFIFPGNVVWQYTNFNTPTVNNTTSKYTFETFDNGKTWLGKFIQYGLELNTPPEWNNI